MERIERFLLGWAKDLLKSFEWGKAIERALPLNLCCFWDWFKTLLSPKWTRDLLIGNGNLSHCPFEWLFCLVLFSKISSILRYSCKWLSIFMSWQHPTKNVLLKNCQPTQQLEAKILCRFPAWCVYRRTVVTVSWVCKAEDNKSFW